MSDNRIVHVHFCEECEKEFPSSRMCFNNCAEHNVPASCVCDFCSSEKVRWAYPAEDFIIGAILAIDDAGNTVEAQPMASKGPWAACDACSELIEREDYAALKQRGFDAIPVEEVVDVDLARTMLANMHGGFREHRTGPRTEVA